MKIQKNKKYYISSEHIFRAHFPAPRVVGRSTQSQMAKLNETLSRCVQAKQLRLGSDTWPHRDTANLLGSARGGTAAATGKLNNIKYKSAANPKAN